MKFFLALIVLAGVALAAPQDPEIAVRAPSTFQNCDCQCDSYTWTSKGRILGNCLSPDATGANFCYVSGIASRACRDVQISDSRADSFSNRGKFYSYEACSTPPRNQCFGSGGPGSNFGEGDNGILQGGGRPGGFGGEGFGGQGFGGQGFGGRPGGFSGQQGFGQQGGFGNGNRNPTNLASILGVRAAGGDAVNA